jgi:hypothetical protein
VLIVVLDSLFRIIGVIQKHFSIIVPSSATIKCSHQAIGSPLFGPRMKKAGRHSAWSAC